METVRETERFTVSSLLGLARMKRVWRRATALCVFAVPIAMVFSLGGCGNGQGTSTTGATTREPDPFAPSRGGTGGGADAPLWKELASKAISVEGGSARSPAGAGRDGGSITLISRGGIAVDAAAAPLAAPAVPTSATDEMLVTATELEADVTHNGTIRLRGMLRAGGADPVRTIRSLGGDIVIEGTLAGADLDAATQGLTLEAQGGSVFVAAGGAIDTSGAAAAGAKDGDAAGAITIVAQNVVVDGKLLASGEAHSAGGGGQGAAISIKASGVIAIGANGDGALVDTSGGDGRNADGDAVGGNAGNIALTANGDVLVGGRVLMRGGAAASKTAAATGGQGATIAIDSDAVVRIAGTIDGRGGPVVQAGEAMGTAGAAGAVVVGQSAPPTGIEIAVALAAGGGSGPAVGGNAGALTLTAEGGDLLLAAPIDLQGAASLVQPGKGGTVTGRVGPTAGGLTIASTINGSGGVADAGGQANGGAGGKLFIEVTSLTGPFVVPAGVEVKFDGGAAAGAGVGGGGGWIEVWAKDGTASMAGHLSTRGGKADPGAGTGGGGGFVHIWMDTNYNGIGGDLTIEPEGVIDSSGGDGAVGGSARNNGGPGVGLFPKMIEQFAVLLDSETIKGGPKDGRLQNLGMIIARGGSSGGWGGDVMFHGRSPTGLENAVSGPMDLEAGGGTGQPGDFVAE